MHGNCHGIIIIITSECHLFSIVYLVSPCSFYFELKNSTSDARINFSESQETPSPQQLDQVKLSMTLLRAKNRIHALTAGP
jgi:hypothetical protein